MNLLGQKKINVDGVYIINVNHQKILSKEQEESKIEYVFLVKKIKMKLI